MYEALWIVLAFVVGCVVGCVVGWVACGTYLIVMLSRRFMNGD